MRPTTPKGWRSRRPELAAAQLVIGVAIGVQGQRRGIVPVGGCAPDLALGIGRRACRPQGIRSGGRSRSRPRSGGQRWSGSRALGTAHAAPDAPVGSRAGRFRRQADIFGRRARIAADRHLMRWIVPDELLALGRATRRPPITAEKLSGAFGRETGRWWRGSSFSALTLARCNRFLVLSRTSDAAIGSMPGEDEIRHALGQHDRCQIDVWRVGWREKVKHLQCASRIFRARCRMDRRPPSDRRRLPSGSCSWRARRPLQPCGRTLRAHRHPPGADPTEALPQ